MKICVHSNRGPRGEETPRAFHLGGHRLHVVSVCGRWTDSLHQYCEVTVDDGRRFVLRFDPGTRNWELAAVFAARSKPAPTAAKPFALRRFFVS